MNLSTPAKINLSLRVRERDATGYHPLLSLVQAVEPLDLLSVDLADEDLLSVEGSALPADEDNLVWKAVRAAVPERKRGLQFRLKKQIPVAAGLGGGSSDAAAALLAVETIFGSEYSLTVAAGIGADVPFFRIGGLAEMQGYGEKLTPKTAARGFHLALVVPPFDLSTPAVYNAWDRLESPIEYEAAGSDLPPSLRSLGPFMNDLYPAALTLAPQLDDWRAELEHRWGRPVLMSGSGPSLFSFFGSRTEAADAIAVAPVGSRFADAVAPVHHGSRIVHDG